MLLAPLGHEVVQWHLKHLGELHKVPLGWAELAPLPVMNLARPSVNQRSEGLLGEPLRFTGLPDSPGPDDRPNRNAHATYSPQVNHERKCISFGAEVAL